MLDASDETVEALNRLSIRTVKVVEEMFALLQDAVDGKSVIDRAVLVIDEMRLMMHDQEDLASAMSNELKICADGLEVSVSDLIFTAKGVSRKSFFSGAKLQKSFQAKRSVAAKLAKDPKQKVKLLVKADWDRWQANPSGYATQAIFIKNMEDKYPEIERHNTFAEWCAEWNKKKPTPAS